MTVRDISADRSNLPGNLALPDNLDAERFVLGAIMSNDNAFLQVAGILTADDFSLEKHKRIFLRMSELHERGLKIDRVTVANELMKHGQLQSVDGLSYLVSLDDGLPALHNLDNYISIVREKSTLRRIIAVSQDAIGRCVACDEDPTQILGSIEDALLKLGDNQSRNSLATPAQIITEYQGGINAFLDTGKRIKGISTGFLKFDEMTGGLREGELIILAARPAMGKCLAADSEIVLANGSVATIEQVCRNQRAELLTLGPDAKLRVTAASAFVDDGIKPVFRVTTKLGRRVDSTLIHPFLTFGGWKPLVELKPGDTIAVPRTMPVFQGEDALSTDRLKLLGYLLGDGGLTDGTPGFTNSDPRLLDEFGVCLGSFEGLRFRMEDSGGERTPTLCIAGDREFVFEARAHFAAKLRDALRQSGKTDRSLARELDISPSLICFWKQARSVPVGDLAAKLPVALQISPEELFEHGAAAASKNSKNALTLWLQNLGLWGIASAGKFVPEPVFRCTRHGIAAFLNRLFATDGWAVVLATGQVQVGFGSVSERLTRQVQHLLLRFGIISKLRRRSVLYRGQRRRSWQLEITDADSIKSFINEIGIFGKEEAIGRVSAALESRKAHTNCDLLPLDVWSTIESAKGDLSWAEVSRRMGFRASHNLHVRTRKLSRKRLLKLAAALQSEHLRDIATSEVYWDRIVSIEYLGQQQVYDLTIPDTHNFIANDICVHNTALALNIAQHVATNQKNRKAVAVFSLEMSKESLLTRMLCASARVDQQRFRAGYLNGDERRQLREAMMEMVEAPLFMDDTAGSNLMDIHSKLRRLQAEQDLGLVVIDYLQLMQGRGRFENRNQEISSLSRGLKLMSKELRVPFLVLSQLSRAPEARTGDHRPMLSDLRESGSIEQDADMVGFIFREEVYRPDKESLKGIAELILAKQRNGPTGRVKLAFLNRYTKFENMAADTGDDAQGFE